MFYIFWNYLKTIGTNDEAWKVFAWKLVVKLYPVVYGHFVELNVLEVVLK